MDKRVQLIVLLIKEDLSRSFKLTQLAAVVNLSPSRLQHIFKTETGLTVTQYQRKLRMEEAKSLLETSFLSVKQIVMRVGTSDRSHFERDFKKTFGVTPVQYRADAMSVSAVVFRSKQQIAEYAIK